MLSKEREKRKLPKNHAFSEGLFVHTHQMCTGGKKWGGEKGGDILGILTELVFLRSIFVSLNLSRSSFKCKSTCITTFGSSFFMNILS